MKWLVLVLCIARYAAGGAIRCATDSGDASCAIEELTKEAAERTSEEDIGTRLIEKSSKNTTKEIVCVANRMFIRDCNTCWCNDDGTGFVCTRKVCVPDLPEHGTEEEKLEGLRIIKKECRPDEVFELDCNMCRCNPDGKSFSCTRRVCVDPTDEESKNFTIIRKTRAAQEVTFVCKNSTEFRMDCNTCLCSDDGKAYSCTRLDCNAQNGSGRRKRDTEENVVNTQDNDVQTLVPQQDPNFVCNPGDAIKIKCNDCTCAADGKNVNCPVRLCDNDTTLPPIN